MAGVFFNKKASANKAYKRHWIKNIKPGVELKSDWFNRKNKIEEAIFDKEAKINYNIRK